MSKVSSYPSASPPRVKITKTAKLKLPPIQKSVPEVFILESLSFDDEQAQRYEGRILSDILRLCGKTPKYFYFRTELELIELVTLFRNSAYRYLHISAHGSAAGINTTLGTITYARFAEIFGGHLKNRRIFLSACSVGNDLLATCMQAANKGMYSIAAPVEDIEFRHAAAIWSALYVRMFSLDSGGMKSKEIGRVLTLMCQLFGIPFFWSYHDAKNNKWVNHNIKASS